MSAPSRQSFIRQPSLLTPLKLLICKTFLVSSASVFAGPEGGTVTGGSGSITTSGTTTTIEQATDRMSIDWQSYNVNSDERVNYIQPDSSSVSLNRILSNQGSRIMGQIDANGHVILVNPNGIIFGKDSVINAGGILASGLSIDPDDFMNGDYTFKAIEGTDGVVINNGLLNASTGGSISLIGQRVENNGLISAKLGAVNLAAGKEAVVTFDEEGLLGVRVSKEILQDDIGVDPAIVNSGEIKAEDGQILISASVSQDIFSGAVNAEGMQGSTSVVVHEDGTFTLGRGANVVNTGSIKASGEVGGDIVLLGENIESSGEIASNSKNSNNLGHLEIHSNDKTLITHDGLVTADAENGIGGDIKLLGNKVGLSENAKVSASGAKGGGQVLVGGDETGANKSVRNAEFIFLGEDTHVNADAWQAGDGGRVITFAENTARIYGYLSAAGGERGGDGGFIETSGLQGFEILRSPIVTSIAGQAGEWLIDPYNITIRDEDDDNINIDETTTTIPKATTFTANNNSAFVDIQNILAVLAGGTVTIQTARPEPDNTGQTGLISLIDKIDYNGIGTGTLVLNAHGDIDLGGNKISDVDNSGDSLNIQFNANYDGSNGNILLGASSIETNGGYFFAQGTNIDLGTSIVSTAGGAIGLDASTSLIGGRVLDRIAPADSNPNYSSYTGGILRTGGGDLFLGAQISGDTISSQQMSASVNLDGLIDVRSVSGGGNVTVNSTNDVALKTFFVGEAYPSAATSPTPKTTNISITGKTIHFGEDADDAADLADIIVEGENIGNHGEILGQFIYGWGNEETTAHTINLNLNAIDGVEFSEVFVDSMSDGNDILNVTINSNTDSATSDVGDLDISNDFGFSLGGGNFIVSNAYDFTLNDFLATNGGNLSVIANSVTHTGLIETSGGNIIIGGSFDDSELGYAKNPIATTITSSDNGEYDTRSTSGKGGNLYIFADEDISLRWLDVRSASTITEANEIFVDGASVTLNSSLEYDLTNFTISAEDAISIYSAYFDNSGSVSADRLNLSLFAGGSYTKTNEEISSSGVITITDADIWLSGGDFVANGYSLDILDTNYDSASDDNGRRLAQDYFATEGGRFIVGGKLIDDAIVPFALGGSFNADPQVFLLTNSRDNASGNTAGDIYINAAGDVTLSHLETSDALDSFHRLSSTSLLGFDLSVIAGDDVFITEDIDFDYLVGSGANSITFTSNNSDTADGTNAIAVDTLITSNSSNDQINLTFNTTGSNAVGFINTQVIDTNGGNLNIGVTSSVSIQEDIETNGGDFTSSGLDFTLGGSGTDYSIDTGAGNITDPTYGTVAVGGSVTINNTGAVQLYDDVTTNGGSFTVGSSTERATSFASYRASGDVSLVDTGSVSGGGDIAIYSVGAMELHVFEFSDEDGVTVNNWFEGETSPAQRNAVDVLLDSEEGTITFHTDWDYGSINDGFKDTDDTEIDSLDPDELTSYISNLVINAGANIDLHARFDNGSDANTLNLTMTAKESINIDDDKNFYLGEGDWKSQSKNLYFGTLSGTGGHLNTEGGDVLIDASGEVEIYVKHYGLRTYGGDFTIGNTISPTSVEIVITAGALDTTVGTNENLDPEASSNGDITITSSGVIEIGEIETRSCEGCGELTLNAGGAVTQTNKWLVYGETDINNSSNTITLTNSENDFNDTVSLDGSVVQITDVNSLDIGASSVGSLDGVASGTISDSGDIVVTGTSSFTAGSNAIILDSGSNNFGDAVTIVSASQLTLNDLDDLILGNITIAGSGEANSITAGGAITQPSSQNISIVSSSASNVVGSLTITGGSVQTNDISTFGSDNQSGGTVTLIANTGAIVTGAITTDSGSTLDPGDNAIDGIDGSGIWDYYESDFSGYSAGLINLTANGADGSVNVQELSAKGASGLDDRDESCFGSCYTGAPGGLGGDITISSTGVVTLAGAVNSDGGNASTTGTGDNDIAPGGNAGIIKVTGSQINVGGNISAQGGYLADSDSVDDNDLALNGASGSITLSGNVVLTDNIVIDNVSNEVTNYEEIESADLTINGPVNASGGSETLTITSSDIYLRGVLGGSSRLGALVLTAIDGTDGIEVGSEAETDGIPSTLYTITSSAITASGSNFYSGNINASGSAGGVIDIDAVGGEVFVGNLNSSSTGVNVGGAITIDAADIAVGSLDSSSVGDNGGVVTITATDSRENASPTISVDGDINASGTTQGAVSFVLAGAPINNVSNGSATFSLDSGFYTSDFSVAGNSSLEAGMVDTLVIQLAGDQTAEWTMDAANSGDITDGSATSNISFNGIENLHGGNQADLFDIGNYAFLEIRGFGGGDEFNILDNIALDLYGGEGNDVFNIDSSVNGRIDGGEDNDEFYFATSAVVITGAGIFGGDGDDEFYLQTDDVNIQVDSLIQGGAGSDTIYGYHDADEDAGNNWELTGPDSGNVSNENQASVVYFSGIETIEGGNQVDTDPGVDEVLEGGTDDFTLSADFTGTIHANSGYDSILVSEARIYDVSLDGALALDGAAVDISDIEAIKNDGSAEGFGLRLSALDTPDDITNTWTISGANTGSVTESSSSIDFEGFEALYGNNANDTFEFSDSTSVVNRIEGGEGVNSVDFRTGVASAGGDRDVFIVDAGSDITESFELAEIDWLVGDSTTTNSITIVSSNNFNWYVRSYHNTSPLDTDPTVNGVNDGQVALRVNASTETSLFNFVDFENITGGSGNDYFTIGNHASDVYGLTGTISGGDGIDRITGRNAEVDWTIQQDAEGYAVGSFTNDIAAGSTSFNQIEYIRGGSAIDDFDLTTVTDVEDANFNIVLNGGDAIDTIDLPAGGVSITIGEDYEGLSLVSIDKIIADVDAIADNHLYFFSGADENVEWWILNTNSGSVGIVGDDKTVFANFGHLHGGAGNDEFDFTQTGTADEASVLSISGVDDSGLGVEETNTIKGFNQSTTWTVTGDQSGRVAFNVSGGTNYVGSFSGINKLQGGTANDLFVVQAAGDIQEFDGGAGAGTNTLRFGTRTNTNSQWSITTSDTSVERRNTSDNSLISTAEFSNIQSIRGGTGTDIFTIQDINTALGITLNAFSGNDELIVDQADVVGNYVARFDGTDIVVERTYDELGTPTTVDLYTISGVELIDAENTSGMTLVADFGSGSNVWNVTGANIGSLANGTGASAPALDFENIGNLEGSTLADTFTFSVTGSISGALDGVGNSGNSLTLEAAGNTWTLGDAFAGEVDSSDVGSAADFTFSNIQSINGNADTLIGRNQNNHWTIVSQNTGSVVQNVEAPTDSISFSGMSNLWGNAGQDDFTLNTGGSVTGEIRGTASAITDGTSPDSITVLSLGTATVNWTVGSTSSSVDRVTAGIYSFENYTGGEGDDNFTISADFNQIEGAAGDDTFTLSATGIDGLIYGNASGETNSGADTLEGAATGTVAWELTDAFEGTYSNGGTVNFEQISTLNGRSSGNDQLTGRSQANDWVINNGVGTVNAHGSTADQVSFSGMDEFVGRDFVDDFTLTGAFGTVVGAGAKDIFRLAAAASGTIYGESALASPGADNVIYGATSGTTEWQLNDATAHAGEISNGGNSVTFAQVNELRGRSTADIIIARDQANDWIINDTASTVQSSSSAADQVTFYGMETKRGGDQIDEFTINQASFGTIEGAGNSDVFILNTGGISGNIFGNVTGGSIGSTDSITGFTSGETVWTLNNANAGTVTNGGGTVAFSQIRTLNGNSTENDVIIGRNQENSWAISATNTVNQYENTADRVTFTGMDVIRGNAQVDHFNVSQSFGKIEGAGASDIFTMMASGIVGTLYGGLEGGTDDADDVLNGSTTGANEWSITGPNSGELTNGASDETITFYQIGSFGGNSGVDIFNLNADFGTIEGGLGEDVFNILAEGIEGTIYGEFEDSGIATDNVINGYDSSNSWLITGVHEGTLTNSGKTITFYQVDTLNGGDGSDQLTARSQSNTWEIGADNGTVNLQDNTADQMTFTSMETMVGGSGTDVFNVRADFGKIFGGNGSDLFYIHEAGITGTIYGQDELAVTNTYTDKLYGDDQGVNQFTITGAQQGTLTNGEVVSFYQVGQLEGRSSSDSLVARNQENTWEINASTANSSVNLKDDTADRMVFVSMETKVGGSGIDTFNINADFNTIEGGAGSDVFNVLVADLNGTIYGGTNAAAETTGNIINAYSNAASTFVINSVLESGEGEVFLRDIHTYNAAEFGDTKDNIQGLNQNNDWRITGDGVGTVTAADGTVVSFTNIEKLSGGTHNDIFYFEAGGLVDNIVAGIYSGGTEVAGAINTVVSRPGVINEWELEPGNSSLFNLRVSGEDDWYADDFSGIQVLQGNGDDIIEVITGAYAFTWNITGEGSGTVAADGRTYNFSGMRHIIGSSGSDTFNFFAGEDLESGGAILGLIDGNTGENTIVGRNAQTLWTLLDSDDVNDDYLNITLTDISEVDSGEAGYVYVKTVERITGIAGYSDESGHDGFNDFLVGVDSSTEWDVTGQNSGSIDVAGVSNDLAFDGIENLEGGAGIDAFVFSTINSSISGLVDGGESAAGDPEPAGDTLTLIGLTNGVIVELGPNPVFSAEPQFGRNIDTVVNANNFETIIGAERTNDQEIDQWVTITHSNDVKWDFTVGMDNDAIINEGYVEEYEPGTDFSVLIENSRVELFNFGSLQGGAGDENKVNVETGNSISGEHVPGSGLQDIEFSGSGFYVVDVDENLRSVQGNNNILIRLVDGTLYNFDTSILINDENAGTFTVDTDAVEDLVITFTGINQFETGNGDDQFIFENDGELTNGSINGGEGLNEIIARTLNVDIAFGLSEVSTTAVRPANGSYPNAGSMPDVYRVLQRGEDDGITEIANVTELNVDATSDVSLYSGESGLYVWNIGEEVDAEGGVEIQNTIERNSITELQFSGINAVFGGNADNEFNLFLLSEVSNVITGGSAGTDTVNLQNIVGDLDISVDTPAVSPDMDIYLAGIEQVNLAEGSHTLFGRTYEVGDFDASVPETYTNYWNLSGQSSGSLLYSNRSQTLSFNNVVHLVGGNYQDEFVVTGAAISDWGTIDAGDNALGQDTLTVGADIPLTARLHELVAGDRIVDSSESSYLDVANFESLTANAAISTGVNTLIGIESNAWIISATGNSVNGIEFENFDNLTGGAGQDQFVFNNALIAGVVDGGLNTVDAVDTVNITNQDNVLVQLGDEAVGDLNLIGIESINATGTGHTLAGENIDNEWKIDTANTGTVNTETAFEGFANLTGGSANDDFIFASTGSLSGIIDGGTNGEDTVALTNITSSLVVSLDQTLTSADLRIQNIDELVANDDATLSNELVAANQENTWIINGRNAGELNGMAFSGFSNLTGNGNVDEFFFDQFTTSIHDVITGVIDGAGNSDIVDTTGVTNDLVIALHDDLDVTADLHLVSIEDVNANTDLQTTNELIGGNANNTWEIDEVNAGTVGTTSFEGFAILTGGGLNDLFRLDGNDTITGAIRGATGADTLDIENLDDAVTVVIGETNLHVGDLVIDSIETINASDLGNTLVAENANNIWTMQLTDSGLLNSDLGYQVAFNGFANLIGGALQDTFNFNREANRDDILTGYIDAGAGDNDIINIDGLLAFETLALGTVGDINVVNSGTLRAINVETVTATNAPANVNYGLVGDNNKNEWLLDGENSGSLDHIAFSGFSNLTGGSQSDDFILDGNDSVSGVIDGGATQNGFKDTVDVKGLNAGITASFDVAYEADLRVQNIDELHAALSETKDNILVGPNSQTSWVINGENEGSMNGTVFSGFNRLIGREAVDSFAFIGTNSVIENGVEGGDNLDDELDMSESIGEVVVRLGQSMPGGVTGVEKFVGNGDTSTIIATEDTVNNWSISRMNGGTLTNGTDTIEFDAFNFLEGGNTTDNFVISAGGGVTGEISAGNGNDTLTIALPETSSGQVVFNGGAGDDDIVINGGVGATTTTYEANDDNETLFYSTQVDESLITYDVVFKDSESVEDNVNSSLLTILTRNNLDETLTLNGGNLTSTDWFQLSDADSGALTRIEFDNKNSISVEGDNTDTDTLLLDGVLIVNNRFSASDLAVVAVDSDVQIQANRAVFESTDGIGTSENRLGLETGSLQLQNLLGDAYIDHEGHLSFSGVTNPAGVVDIIASGNITSTGVLDSDNAFVLVSEGDITLSQANTLNGSVSLLTDKGVIEFANNDGTQFGNVSADKMTFTVTGNVSDSGVMSISDLVVNADASTAIDLSGSGHSFGQVVVNNANSVNIVNSDTDGMAVVGRGISGDFIAVSQSELNAGTISANNIVLTSNEAAVAIQNAQSAINSIFIEGEGVEIGNSLTVSSNISGNAITVIGNTGAVAIDRAINATNSSTGVSGDIVISGNTISQGNNGLISGENIALAANDDISLAANITAIGDLAIKSENGAINVSSTGATATTFQAQFLTMNAAGQLAVQDIDAERLFFEAGSMLQNGIITLASNEVEPEMSVINLSGQLQTAGSSQIIVDDQSLQINAGSALLNGTLSSQGSLDINLQSSSTIATQIAANDVNIDVASGGLQMQNGSTIAAVESAAVIASGNIQLAQVVATAEEGSVQLVSGGAITDSNGDANNVTSYNLDFATESGFGTDTDPLELVIGNLHGINNSGMVNIENTGDVSITALRNNGDIKLYNFTGDVTMVQTTENYDNKQSAIAGTNNAMTAGGVIATRYTTGTITLEVEGDLLATGNRFQFERPDVVADHVNILTEGAFGSIGRPLMLFVRTSGTILPLGRGAKPDCGFNTCPANGFDGIEDLTDTSVFGSVNELLVEVEPIDQVDPAVFTDLRNYSFDDISILMPRDQRYDDDTDEDSYL
ncbi:Heme/hemopexin-binding protein [Thalassocella blandensis]|nr:Heme/hemopexin-binding protein [Thalassocella blandensis]